MTRRSRSSLRLSLFAAPVAMACAVNFLGDLGTSQSVVGNVFRVEAFPSVSGLEAGDEFGASGTSLGDLDGDGVEDWLIGAPEDDDGGEDRGAIYFLFMRADGTLRTQWKISDTSGGFGGYLQDRARFGFSVANLGDLDADGVTEVAVGAPGMKEVWILFLRPNATFKNVVSIADTPPSFAFGFSLAVMGDLDGDGIQELACGDPLYRCSVGGCPYPYDGATFVYFLNPDGTTRAIQTITHASAGFQDTLSPYDYFGGALSCTSDLDSDGLRELVVSAPGRSCGTVWILYLNPDASVRQAASFVCPSGLLGWGGVVAGTQGSASGPEIDLWVKNSSSLYGYALDPSAAVVAGGPRNTGFGQSGSGCWGEFCAGQLVEQPAGFLVDLGTESNGVGRVLEGRPDTNLLRVLVHSSPDASWTYRNGSGTNQWILANQSQPRIGASWNTSLNCIGHSPSAAFLFMFESPSLGPQIPAGELLVDTLSQRYLLLMTPHSSSVASFHVPIPNDPALCALRASVQGVCLGSPGLTLSNAIDIQIGL